MKRLTQLFLFTALGFGLLATAQWRALPTAVSVQAQDGLDMPLAVDEWQNTQQQLSSADLGAKSPHIAISPDGSKLIVAYTRQMSSSANNTDIYYALSDDEGVFWNQGANQPGPIYTSDGIPSTAVNVVIDSSNTAHAAWLEAGKIVYKAEGNWGASEPMQVNDTTFAQTGPQLAVETDGTLHAIWAEPSTQGGSPKMRYARLPSGGSAWTVPSLIFNSQFGAEAPALAIDNDNNLYAVWSELLFGAFNGNQVNYARKADGSNSWTTVQNISSKASLPANWSALLPQIEVAEDQIEVYMTGLDKAAPIPEAAQGVFRTVCASGSCTSLSNWSQGLNLLAGNYVGVNNNFPSNMLSGVARSGGCTQIVFHGTDGQNNEQLWHNRGCDSQGKQEITAYSSSYRYINPTVTQNKNWFVHLAYERSLIVDQTTAVSQIYYRRLEPNIYLPFIVKQ